MDDEFLKIGLEKYGRAKALLDGFSQEILKAIVRAVREAKLSKIVVASTTVRDGEAKHGREHVRWIIFQIGDGPNKGKDLELGVSWDPELDHRPRVYAAVRDLLLPTAPQELVPIHYAQKRTYISVDPRDDGWDIAKAVTRLLRALDGLL